MNSPVQSHSITSLLTSFSVYLQSLSLSSISRKLYRGDVARFLAYLATPNLDNLSTPKTYLDYLSRPELKISSTLSRRHLASLKQFGSFFSLTYNLPNPTQNLSLGVQLEADAGLIPLSKYIKTFTEYLKEDHLSNSTIKSYKSDMIHYLTWGHTNYPSTHIVELLSKKITQKYMDSLVQSMSHSQSTILRKSKVVSRFAAWLNLTMPQVRESDNNHEPSFTRTTMQSSPLNSVATDSQPLFSTNTTPNHLVTGKKGSFVKMFNYRTILAAGILLVLSLALSIFAYRQFSSDVKLTAAFPNTPITPNRQLSFQGRLENAAGTPITSATNFVFKLFDASSVGTELYSSGTCSITPDTDGVFSTQIGDTCGAGIASSVFTENADVWMEVTVGAETLTPRQQIATVAYALNSETIQGFPISATVSAIRNTVVPMNQWGEIIVGEQSPRLTGVAGTFAISAPSLSLTTAVGTNGNITLAPDGTGQVNLNGNTTSTSFFNINNAQLTTGSLITGTAANNNTGFKLFDLLSGSSPTSKFSVTDAGNVTLAGDLTITGDDLFMNTNTAGMILVADGTNFNPTAMSGDITINGSGATTIGNDKITEGMLKSVNAPTDELCLSYESTVGDFEWQTCGSGGGGSNWRINAGTLSPNNDTLDLLVGSNATGSAKFSVNATNGNTAIAGNLNLTSVSNLIFGTTSLAETTSAIDSGAYLVGAFDEFDNSNSTNVQDVLDDLDAGLTAVVSGSSLWTDAGSYLYPTGGEVLGNATLGGTNKLAGIYLADTAPLVFGTDNDFSFAFNNATSTLGSTLTTGTRLGINTTNALATFDLRSSLGTIPVASISGNTSMSALIVDQSGSGDIFTASSAGQTRFVVKNNGNVGIDVSDPTNKLEIGGSTSTISNDAGDITIDSASNNVSFAGDSLINLLNLYASGELGVGVADAIGTFHVHGVTVGKALAILDELGDQDILVASASGYTKARLTNSGSLSLDGDYLNFGLTDSSSGYGFRDNGGTLQFKHNSGSWADVGSGSGGASWWDQTLGTLQPYNTTVDLLLGGTATDSAKFGFINVGSGTPTATISAGSSGALYMTADGTIATTAKQTLALGNATTTGNIILQGGNVGIGVASPTQKLEVNGYIVGQRFEDSSSSTYYVDPAAAGTSVSIDGDIVSNGAFSISSNGNNNITINAGSGTVLIGAAGAGKLDAGTIDPPYTINGDKFATYVAGMTGVKEETTGVVTANEYVAGIGYRATLDFANSLTGSDLWLFSKASSLKNQLDKLVVLLSSSGNTKTWYQLDAQSGKLHLYAQTPTTISYRLTAPRYDATAWLNTRGDDSESIGHVINDEDTWSVSSAIANFFEANTTPELISPLASGSPIIISENPDSVQALPPTSNDPLVFVDGELAAATISARVAKLTDLQAQNITAQNITADTITANTIIGLDAKIASLSGLTDQEFDSITDRIKARLSELTDPVTAQDIPLPDQATDSAELQDSLLTPSIASGSASLSSADIDFVTINNYLAVIGQATITTLDVTNTLYVSTLNSKSGMLALGDNVLLVDNTGNVAINGDLTVSGKILAQSASVGALEIGAPADASSSSALGNLLSVYNESGVAIATIDASGSANLASLTTNMITIASSGTATDSSALSSLIGTSTSNATAGVATLVTPNTELIIESPYITPNSLVYLTPTGNTDNKVLFIKSKTSCSSPESSSSLPAQVGLLSPCYPSFTVGIDSPASSDISFNWWIIELAPITTQTQLDQQL